MSHSSSTDPHQFVKNPVFIGPAVCIVLLVVFFVGMRIAAAPQPCKKVDPNMIVAGNAIISQGKGNTVCIYNAQERKWDELVVPAAAPQPAPVQ